MSKKIAVFGGSFNPPASHHRSIAEELSRLFDEVIVVPCGPRPDKLTVGGVEPHHRAVMADLAFRGLPKVRVELFDLEENSFTRLHRLEDKLRHRGELWHVVGTDLVTGGSAGASQIQTAWERGPDVWNDLRFAVVARRGHEIGPSDLPPNHLLIEQARSGASTEIREKIYRRESVAGLVDARVADYIDRYNLYRGLPPARSAAIRIERPRPLLVYDEKNPAAVRLAESFAAIASETDPNCIAVIGGDGTMMRAIGKHWRSRLPFYGINVGHRGHLLNEIDDPAGFLSGETHLSQLPLIYAETTDTRGVRSGSHAVNDAWVERASGQAAWIQVLVNGEMRIPRLVADGVLVATPAGSTAYARAMGATPLPMDARGYLLVGSNVTEPAGWKSAYLQPESGVEFRALDPQKRPIRAFVDGREKGTVVSLSARISRAAAVEVAFCPSKDLAAKLSYAQFQPFN